METTEHLLRWWYSCIMAPIQHLPRRSHTCIYWWAYCGTNAEFRLYINAMIDSITYIMLFRDKIHWLLFGDTIHWDVSLKSMSLDVITYLNIYFLYICIYKYIDLHIWFYIHKCKFIYKNNNMLTRARCVQHAKCCEPSWYGKQRFAEPINIHRNKCSIWIEGEDRSPTL